VNQEFSTSIPRRTETKTIRQPRQGFSTKTGGIKIGQRCGFSLGDRGSGLRRALFTPRGGENGKNEDSLRGHRPSGPSTTGVTSLLRYLRPRGVSERKGFGPEKGAGVDEKATRPIYALRRERRPRSVGGTALSTAIEERCGFLYNQGGKDSSTRGGRERKGDFLLAGRPLMDDYIK